MVVTTGASVAVTTTVVAGGSLRVGELRFKGPEFVVVTTRVAGVRSKAWSAVVTVTVVVAGGV